MELSALAFQNSIYKWHNLFRFTPQFDISGTPVVINLFVGSSGDILGILNRWRDE